MKRRTTRLSANSTSKQRRKVTTSSPLTDTTPTEATMILDLNDDCFFEIFKYLDVMDMCSVADSCSRLKAAAREHFAHSKFNNFNFPLSIRDRSESDTANQMLLEASKVLRNFGACIADFRETNGGTFYKWDDETKSVYQRKIIELLVKHCGEKLIKLKFWHFDITDEISNIMIPLLEHLQKFEITYADGSVLLLEMLPILCPKLQDLTFAHIDLRFEGWNRRYEKLTKIKFLCCDMDVDTAKEFLKCNMQLKEIEFNYCSGLNPRLFQYIGDYATEVETLDINLGEFDFDEETPDYSPNAQHIQRLRNLKSIRLTDWYCKIPYLTEVICHVAAAEVSLKTLDVTSLKLLRMDINRFVDGISKLKTLETLYLDVRGDLHVHHITHICQNLSKLTKLSILMDKAWTMENILQLVRNAEKLQSLTVKPARYYLQKVCVNDETYTKLANIVEKRNEKTHLKITLHARYYFINISEVLTKAHDKLLSVVLTQYI